ncbi:hypothetical protein Y032_0338g2932 [Ancylostoma ceylanicum]|uniref:Uncharacterized protein n=1 Tax=Ancylostoma ceylanicum TaxID=53326 RepID=A0A016RYW1_9BILA|nr:hypothetical protein Y032_0338g2932 [Ancylostoma ceylanicum]
MNTRKLVRQHPETVQATPGNWSDITPGRLHKIKITWSLKGRVPCHPMNLCLQVPRRRLTASTRHRHKPLHGAAFLTLKC